MSFQDLRNKGTAQLAAFVLLAGFTGYAFTQERAHSNQNRRAVAASTRATARSLATTTYDVLVQGCYSGNELRNLLNQRNDTFHRVVINTDKLFAVVADSPGVSADLKSLLLGAARENERIASSVTKIPARDCAQAYAKLRPIGVGAAKRSGN